MDFGASVATYTIKGNHDTVESILGMFPAEPESWQGNKGVQVTMTQNGTPVADISVNVVSLVKVPRSEVPKEEADFGSDGEGNIDYDDWTMKRDKQLNNDEWKLEWEDVRNFLPFANYGTQLIDPWTLAAYKLLVDGDHFEGDIVTINVQGTDKTDKISSFSQITDHSSIDGWNIGDINPVSRSSTAYAKLMKGKVLVLTHSWSEQWVVSAKKFEKMQDEMDELTGTQKLKYQEMLSEGKIMVSTTGRGNADGPVKDGEKTSKTYTITRTFTHKEEFTASSKSKIPHGLKLKVPEKEPNP